MSRWHGRTVASTRINWNWFRQKSQSKKQIERNFSLLRKEHCTHIKVGFLSAGSSFPPSVEAVLCFFTSTPVRLFPLKKESRLTSGTAGVPANPSRHFAGNVSRETDRHPPPGWKWYRLDLRHIGRQTRLDLPLQQLLLSSRRFDIRVFIKTYLSSYSKQCSACWHSGPLPEVHWYKLISIFNPLP